MENLEPYSFEAHVPHSMKGIPWNVCAHCGLIYLNNKLTQWCIKKGCNSSEHPEYHKKLKELGKRNV